MKTPINLKFKRFFLFRLKKKTKVTLVKCKILYGLLGIQLLYQTKLRFKEIESARICIKRKLNYKKKLVRIWIRFFPYISVTKKPIAMRMGKGKGNIDAWFSPFLRGQILFELKIKHSNFCHFFLSLLKAFSKSKFKISKRTKVIYLIY